MRMSGMRSGLQLKQERFAAGCGLCVRAQRFLAAHLHSLNASGQASTLTSFTCRPTALACFPTAGTIVTVNTLAPWAPQVRYEAAHSWTDRDIDALLPPGSLLHLSGDARWRWTHGTRLGVEKLQEAAGAGAEAGGKLPEAGEGVAGGRGARGAGEGGLGVQQGQGGAERARARLWCWFGRPEELVERGLERHSVVFAFGNPDK